MAQRVTTNRPALKRGGLHKLECSARCGGYAYTTVSQLETVGSPSCACGQPFEPATLELALLLGLEDHPLVHELQRMTSRKETGQLPASKRPCQSREHLASMGERALRELLEANREDARARRVAALNRGRTTEPITARADRADDHDEIPF